MIHFIAHSKIPIVLSVTGLLDFLAMITTEQVSTWFQLGTLLGIAVVGFLNRLDARKVLALAADTARMTAKTSDTTDKIHALSNSSMAAQLRIVWLQANRIAEMTKSKADVDIASEAKLAYDEHQKKQAMVDADTTSP